MLQNDRRNHLLNGWKEIAQYLGRGVRTVQRWETELALPVRRPRGRSRSAVLAFTADLDGWLLRVAGNPESASAPAGDVQRSGLRVLVIENSVPDLNICAAVLRRIGATEIDMVSSVPGALLRLEHIATNKLPKPDILILDLSFAYERGLEILRYKEACAALQSIEVVIWSSLAEEQKDLCSLFSIQRRVPKSGGTSQLETALKDLSSRRFASAIVRSSPHAA